MKFEKPKLQFSNFYPNLTLPPLNLIKHQHLLQASTITAAAVVLFLRDPDCCWLAAAAPPPQILDHSHTVNLRNFSPLSSSYFCFFVFAILLSLVP